MSCVLSIIGKELDIDSFVEKSKLSPHKKRYIGEAKSPNRPNGAKMMYSALSIEVSDADFTEFETQIKDAVKFLKSNKSKLKHVGLTKEIEYATLRFGIEMTIDKENVLSQSSFIPNELLKLAGNLNLSIEISLYPKDFQQAVEKLAKRKK